MVGVVRIVVRLATYKSIINKHAAASGMIAPKT